MLRQDTAICLTAALKSASALVRNGNDCAAVASYGDSHNLLVGHNYWGAPEPFERWVAQTALWTQNYGALVVPLLYRQDAVGATYRDPHADPIAGESHMLFCLTWHEREGFDLHRAFYTRRPNGEPVFDTLESITGAVQLPESAPGAALIQSAIQHPGGSL